ncbi:zinc finger protein 91 isoform X1 [Anguilla anguilla]|uniref:zinc finger protein 91 isoform X1 n=1 Tax=Anguilla anguilla TaxID=7936 RepID=UPI0015A83B1F|nr:zinc finger protein 91 isoform X1 [Anguilla anguilla]
MAAVYTVNGGRIETNVEELSVENKQPGVKKTVVSPLPMNSKIIKVEQSSEDEDSSNAEPTPTKRRPETAVMDAAPAIAIKEERIEEDEYVQIKLVDVDESLERTPNKESNRDNESVDGDWLFRCVDCGEAFGQREAYLEHQREHVHDGPIVCLDSDAQWDDLLVSEDGGRRTLCCAICGRKFSSSRGFFTHQLKHRNQALKQEPGAEVAVPKQRLFECEYCGKTYSSIGLCLNHQRSHKQASKSVFHQLAHLKKKSFQCPTCGRSYSRASALDAHRRCHEVKLIKSRNSGAEKPLSTPEPVVENGDVAIVEDKKHKLLYECRECGRAFSTTTGLSTHQRFTSHSKCLEVKLKEDAKKSFSCSECDKSFLTSTALAIHQRWHIRRAKIGNSGQSFSCEECGKIFTSLTFYEKHQRVVHSGETPAKSFLHQVCQLKKKAFECQDCGRRFSRATALQSHQLCHTDVFGNATEKAATQKPVTTPTSLSPPQKLYLCDKVKPESFAIGALVYSQETPQANQVSEDLGYNEADDHAVVDENEIDDLIVEVVSISGSDDSFREHEPEPEPVSESKTEPEMECDSHQEAKKGKVPLSLLDEAPLPLKSKAGADLEMDYEAKQVESERNPPQKTSFDCPECGRRFSSASAIRCHRLWHRGPMGRAASIKTWKRNAPTQAYLENGLYKCNECGKESTTLNSHYNHMRQHEDPKPYKSLSYQLAGLQKKNFKCEVCGLRFSRASALQSHQQHHAKQVRIERTHKCAHCEKSYSSYGALYNHRKACHSVEDKSDTAVSIKKEVFNPRKTLLGPKVYHCEQCGKGFWSFGAFSQHKQNQHCTEVKENNDTSEPLTSVNGHTRSISKRATCPICRKRFRHRGILACHMKRHRSMPQMNHTCKVCGKSYRMLTCFLKHQQVHDSEGIPPPVKSFEQQIEQLEKNTYSCPDCGKRFSRAMALQFHMRSHGYETGYPFSSLSNSDAQVFKCSFCPALFSVNTELQDHLSKKHSGCLSEVTDQTSELAQGVSNDSLKSVSDAPNRSLDCGKYQCKECGRRFSVIGALNFHKRIHRKSQTAVDVSSSPVSVVQETKCKEEGSESKGLYICPECGRSFGTNSALGTHRRWHTDKKFASTLSTDTSTSRKDKTVNEGPYRCNICRKGFFYYCVLRRHQMHHPESEAQTQPASSLESTQVSRSNPSSKISCPKCERSFPRASILATHYQTHHANVSDCDQCNLSFSSENDMLKHRSQVHSGEECAQLGEPVSEKPASATSKKVKLKLHGCPDCGKRFYKVRGLRAHRWQMHRKSRKTASSKTASKSFVCTGCEKRYSSQGALYNHRKVCVVTERKLKSVEAEVQDPVPPPKLPEHTYKWLFKCHKCGKAFPSLERLEAHKDIAKSRPFCCALCCRGYWTETQLQQHLVWHDEVRRRLPADLRYRLSTFSAPTEVGPKSEDCVTQYTQDQTNAATTGTPSRVHYKCPHCEETFLNFLALQQHQTVHSMDDPYRCSLCPRTFSQIHELIDHHQECMSEKKERNENGGDSILVDRARDGDGLTCIDCGITFTREVELHQHYIAHASGQY